MIPFIASIFGLLIGSFLNVCIYRWPRDESVVKPRSHCPHCNTTVGWQDNIPLLGYILLNGRCRHCSEPISILYPTVELLNAAFYGYLFWRGGVDPMTFKVAVFTSMMLILIFTDLTEYILPDEITLGGLLVALLFIPIVPVEDRFTGIIWLFAARPAVWIISAIESIFSAAFIGGILYGLRSAYFRVRKIEGLGLGDVKMMAMVGAFWGLAPTIMILMMGSILGAVVGVIIIIASRKKWQHELPFGTYLGATSIVVAIWGEDILVWYQTAVLGPPA